MYYYDSSYILFFLLGTGISLLASAYVKLQYSKYKKIQVSSGMTGSDLVAWFIRNKNIQLGVRVVNKPLADNYDPRNETVTLSREVATIPSIASVAITAHELGHVMQRHSNYPLFKLRSALVPVTNIGSNLGYWLMFIGLVLNFFDLALIGLLFFSFSFLFVLVTLPIEFDASSRALKLLKENDLLTSEELKGAKAVLTAAALTYVAAVFASLLNILYFAMRVFALQNRDDR